jgi:putative hydrolase of the HAD superfamily
MLKAVLFDMDQTLIDWDHVEEPWEEYQFRRMKDVYEFVHANLHRFNGKNLDQFFEAYLAALNVAWQHGKLTLRAPSIATIMADALKACGIPEDRLDIEAVVDAYNWQPPAGERAYPDVFEVLSQLREHGVELGIVTNSAHPMQLRDRELRAVGLLDLFPTCRVSAVDVGYLKPHRTIFERALDRLGVQPEETVFVGDDLRADIGGAQVMGMHGVLRVHERAGEANDESADHEGDRIVPDGTISTLHDLLPLLDGWYPGWRNGHL